MENRFALDAKIKKTALAKGYDSIVLMAPKAFTEFKKNGKMPRSLELNIFIPEAITQTIESSQTYQRSR